MSEVVIKKTILNKKPLSMNPMAILQNAFLKGNGEEWEWGGRAYGKHWNWNCE